MHRAKNPIAETSGFALHVCRGLRGDMGGAMNVPMAEPQMTARPNAKFAHQAWLGQMDTVTIVQTDFDPLEIVVDA